MEILRHKRAFDMMTPLLISGMLFDYSIKLRITPRSTVEEHRVADNWQPVEPVILEY